MLDRDIFASQMNGVALGILSLQDFEDWFEEHSWNVHQRHDEGLTAAVFRVESLFSAYEEGRLEQEALTKRIGELAHTIRPFEARIVWYAAPSLAVMQKPRVPIRPGQKADPTERLILGQMGSFVELHV